MNPLVADEFFRSDSPVDVQATVAWLLANGYGLSSQSGEGAFGARFVFRGPAEVRITVDRSQWLLDVAVEPGADAWQYDLLLAARSGRTYGEVFPARASRQADGRLPDQLPEGVSWRQTLPDVLAWVRGPGVGEAVERASRERFALMRPGR
ncbi:hypothetical protein [Actinotalea solisilvae]|uniref:hypothetical protein n=1 Tax=Actinotalea solisilvae TaxID=2072922 RepID=UPI0018F158BA|nr:hypothetical protein [Actinotalea solisilvae]